MCDLHDVYTIIIIKGVNVHLENKISYLILDFNFKDKVEESSKNGAPKFF